MSNQTTTPPDTSGIVLPPMPTGAGVTGAIPEPTALGVAKYQTVGGKFVYQGTKYQRVVQGTKTDPKTGQSTSVYYAVDNSGNILSDASGNPIEDTPVIDRSGSPVRIQAEYASPPQTHFVGSADHPQFSQSQSYGVARYNQGDEVSTWYGMAPEERAQVMQAMVDRGLAPANGSTSGLDQSWVSGFMTVLQYANANNQTWNDALRTMPLADRTSTKTVQANAYTPQLDSPQDLAAVFKKAAASMIGGGQIPQTDIDNYVRAYQEMQRQDNLTQIAQKEAAAQAPQQRIQVDANGNPIGQLQPGAGELPEGVATPNLPGGVTGSNGIPKPIINEHTAIATPDEVAQQYIKSHFASQVNATNTANAYNLFINSMQNLGKAAAPSTQGTVTGQ